MPGATPPSAARELLTSRLRLVAADARWAAALTAFHTDNRAHLEPWEPPVEADFYTPAAQATRLAELAARFDAGSGYHYLIQPIGDARRVIGSINFSDVARRSFQSCHLGYALDHRFEGQALMTEALACAIGEMFSPHVNLHRIQAAVRPENWRSVEVLKRLGFHDEGLAVDYLYIDGLWRTHRLTALLNKRFVAPPDWPR